MKPRQKRIFFITLLVVVISSAVTLALTAFQQNLMFFYSPSEVIAGSAPKDYKFRLGGMVENGSFQQEDNSLKVNFRLTDFQESVLVEYTGILPDLFREGQGIVAHGVLNDLGIFIAEEVLAKHDENYMPPEIAEALANSEE